MEQEMNSHHGKMIIQLAIILIPFCYHNFKCFSALIWFKMTNILRKMKKVVCSRIEESHYFIHKGFIILCDIAGES